ncbi:MAG: DNA-protecting protein DprA [Actinobacteria bacterium]|nr:DNA-protecting protein DprA [Actinomycetota bacterium]
MAATIHASTLKRPGALLGLGADEIGTILGLERSAANRLERLLVRGGQLAFELERLMSRGIWLLTRADEDYPPLLKERLRRGAPPVLYGVGEPVLLRHRTVAVVGSRDADAASLDFTTALGRRLATDGIAVASGAARGVDTTAMTAAVDAGGVAVGVVADALDKAFRRQDLRAHISDGVVVLLSAVHPEARFTVANAMRRNRFIYCLAEAAIVVASGAKGGTREGALENLKAGWVPLFVRVDSDAPGGNRELLRTGALRLTRDDLEFAGLLDRLSDRAPGEQMVVEAPPTPSLPKRTEPVDVVEADLYQLVWPRLATYLTEPRSEREVADYFALELVQARAWLKRGVESGLLERVERLRRYRLTSTGPPPLFDRPT